jgi:hypothetical protein
MWMVLGVVLFVVALASAALGYYARVWTAPVAEPVAGRTIEPPIRPVTKYEFDDRLSQDTQVLRSLYVTGTWLGPSVPYPINTVRIRCNVFQGMCEMHQAEIGTSETRLGAGDRRLGLYYTVFKIDRVDDQLLTATDVTQMNPCVRQVLNVDRRAKAVSLVRTKHSKGNTCSLEPDGTVTIYLGDPEKGQ